MGRNSNSSSFGFFQNSCEHLAPVILKLSRVLGHRASILGYSCLSACYATILWRELLVPKPGFVKVWISADLIAKWSPVDELEQVITLSPSNSPNLSCLRGIDR